MHPRPLDESGYLWPVWIGRVKAARPTRARLIGDDYLVYKGKWPVPRNEVVSVFFIGMLRFPLCRRAYILCR
jgi:hypothetical protein